jgi:GDPmannose 4,6-dehydratase
VTRALITGVTGQDGSYLAEILAAEGVEVFGMIRDLGHPRREWIEALVPSLRLKLGDLRDPQGLERIIEETQPDEIYNLAAVTTPGEGWTAEPTPLVAEVTGLGVINLLRATQRQAPDARFVQASSSAVYDPRRYGLYGVAKKLAHDSVIGFRERYDVHTVNAILYSHTSPRQSSRYLIKRIVRHVVQVKTGVRSSFVMTNRTNRRDWGYARDYARALVALARTDYPFDHDVRTGMTYPAFAVAAIAASHLQVDLADVTADWPKEDTSPTLDEVLPGENVINPNFKWEPETSFAQLVRGLCDYEMWGDV